MLRLMELGAWIHGVGFLDPWSWVLKTHRIVCLNPWSWVLRLMEWVLRLTEWVLGSMDLGS